MRRRHWFELEDEAWFPGRIRDFMTDYLGFVVRRFGLFDPAVPILVDLLRETGRTEVLDLASGAGGPWPALVSKVAAEVPELRVTLSDLYPNEEALQGIADADERIDVARNRIDAVAVPESIDALRTQFLSLHHFKPRDARSIFADAVECGVPIAVFEAQKRDVRHLVQFALSPIAVLLMTPMVRPVRLTRFLFTYVLPIVPLCVFWDGIVSVLRTYTLEEMLFMARAADPKGAFEWEVGETDGTGPTMIWLTGRPK